MTEILNINLVFIKIIKLIRNYKYLLLNYFLTQIFGDDFDRDKIKF